jgi:hypothetical protein
MENTKAFWKSKTLWGAVIVLVCLSLRMFGQEETAQAVEEQQESILALVAEIGTLIGSAVAIWGRITAKHALGVGNGNS